MCNSKDCTVNKIVPYNQIVHYNKIVPYDKIVQNLRCKCSLMESMHL